MHLSADVAGAGMPLRVASQLVVQLHLYVLHVFAVLRKRTVEDNKVSKNQCRASPLDLQVQRVRLTLGLGRNCGKPVLRPACRSAKDLSSCQGLYQAFRRTYSS